MENEIELPSVAGFVEDPDSPVMGWDTQDASVYQACPVCRGQDD
jgi:hypothetical protein